MDWRRKWFDDERGETAPRVALTVAVLAAVASLAAGLFSLVLNGRVAELETAVAREQLELARQEFSADEKARRNRLLTTYIPMIMSDTPNDVEAARAVLFVVFPNDAKAILESALKAATAATPEQQLILEETVAVAEEVAAETGTWAVVISAEPDLPSAKSAKAEAGDFGPLELLKRDDTWFVVRTDLPNQKTAEEVLIGVRGLLREDAFVVNFNEFCPNAQDLGADSDDETQTLCESS
jgi:hypothetical protein